jgi:hypothetical protein
VAKSAVTELNDQIEAIRQEAYNEGYAAAMRAVVEFSASGTAKPKASIAKATLTKTTSAKPITATTAAHGRRRRTQAKPAARQTRRGENARRIAEAMMTLPDHTGPAASIKKALAGKGHDIPYTSIRHGLGQLQARGEASLAADGRTWSYAAQQH